MNYSNSFCFQRFYIREESPSNMNFRISIWLQKTNSYGERLFYFTGFSAKWDPIPSMLCQNHTQLVKGFMGQTTGIWCALNQVKCFGDGDLWAKWEAHVTFMVQREGMFTFYGGHDPEDFQHQVGDPPTVLDLHSNSPGYVWFWITFYFHLTTKKEKVKT
jgi:hypothetical protein